MRTEVTGTFQLFEPITLIAASEQEVDQISEMFFANGALTVFTKGIE